MPFVRDLRIRLATNQADGLRRDLEELQRAMATDTKLQALQQLVVTKEDALRQKSKEVNSLGESLAKVKQQAEANTRETDSKIKGLEEKLRDAQLKESNGISSVDVDALRIKLKNAEQELAPLKSKLQHEIPYFCE